MEFTNEFSVPVNTDQAWSVLTDVPRIAPCLPGATVESLDDNTYAGTVTVKVGPIKASYAGTARFRDLDRDALRMMLHARGKEDSGKGGSASAAVTVTLHGEAADKTRVRVHTELEITGKLAQFGRNAMADVGARLIEQFAGNLENLLVPERPISRPAPDAGQASQPARAHTATPAGPARESSEIDAFAMALPIAKRALPAIAAFTTGAFITWLLGRLRRSPAPARRVAPSGYAPS